MSQTPEFRPGIYMHYKGGLYSAFGLIMHHETREPAVDYVSHTKGNRQYRELRQPLPFGLHPVDRNVDAWTDVVEWQVPMPDGSAATHGPRFVFVKAFA
jgi:hypothetical protein